MSSSGRFVRVSKFRHVHGQGATHVTDNFTDIKADTTGEGNFIHCGAKYLCYSSLGGGGPVMILNINKPTRVLPQMPVVNVHKAKVVDCDFSPFDPHLLATISDDCHICLTKLPNMEECKENINKPDIVLTGHSKKLSLCHWNPCANNILAVSDYAWQTKIWDVNSSSLAISLVEHPDLVQSFEWNTFGNLIGTTCKDHNVRLFDPRQNGAIVEQTAGFEGAKSQRFFWMDSLGLFGITGFSKTSTRRLAVYDPRNISTKLTSVDIDQSAGVVIPYFDEDSSILFLTGKGDGNIRFFEMVKEPPYAHYVNDFRSNNPQKGVCWYKKLYLNTPKCEIARGYRLTRDIIEPVSFVVPRKSEIFQDDIYPDTQADIPTMDSADWLSGKNKLPIRVSMNPETHGEVRDSKDAAAPAFKAQAQTTAKSDSQDLEKKLQESLNIIEEQKKEIENLKKEIEKLSTQ